MLLASNFAASQNRSPIRRATQPNIQDILGKFRIASFTGTSQDSIQATATDKSGNVYVAGTTFSGQFPVKNAEQPVFGDASILQTTDLGMSWTRVGGPPGGALTLASDPVVPEVMFASAATGIFKSTDSGGTWLQVYVFPGVADGAPLAIDPGNHLRIAAITPSGMLIRSIDDGASWTVGGACGSLTCGGELFADPTGSGTLLAVGLGTASISRDWGLTFQSFGQSQDLTAIAFDPSHPGWIYADYGEGTIGSLYLTTDYGTTWTQKASPPSDFSAISDLAVEADQPGTLVALTVGAAFFTSSDGAATWTLETTFKYSFNPETFVLAPETCNSPGGLFAVGVAVTGTSSVSFSTGFGTTWNTPQLTGVTSVTAGGACAIYVTRALSSDAFVAKISSGGEILWTTYLGGSDQDTAVALALDPQGNAYVAGNTSSPDFPLTVPHLGPQGENSVFLTKFSPDGALVYSATLGGEASNTAVALAMDASQNAYLAGTTDSLQFPVTPGAIVATVDQGSYTGFLAKLSSGASLSYATYLGSSYTFADAILVDANEEAIVAGSGPVPGLPPPPTSGGQAPVFVMKLNAAASQVLTYAYLPAGAFSISGLASDSQNNLVVFGEAQMGSLQPSPGGYHSTQPATPCNEIPLGPEAGDGFLMMLSASGWQPVYTAVLTAACGIETGSIAIDGTGASVLAIAAGGGFALQDPIVAGPSFCAFSSAIAKLSADGSTLQFATYLNNCGVPGIALAPDGSVYAGVSPLPTENTTSVLHLKTSNAAAISLNGLSNAFSGDASAVVYGGLYSIAISGFEPPAMNLGLNPAQNLPIVLGGVQVKFDGVSASILATGPGQIIVAAPAPIVRGPGLDTEGSNADVTFASVQLVYNGTSSNPVWMPLSKTLPGLLTVDFPNAPPPAPMYPDANARDADGTVNSIDNPALAGSTITVFATGMGAAAPSVASGSIAGSVAAAPVTPVYSSWETIVPGETDPSLAVSSIPGFVSAMFQIQVPIPADIQSLNGTDVGNGISRVGIGLVLNVTPVNLSVSNLVGVYVK